MSHPSEKHHLGSLSFQLTPVKNHGMEIRTKFIMRMFRSTKVLLILALLLANIGTARRASAFCCTDPNCCKTCGAISEVTGFTRSFAVGTCWVTLCFVESSLCNLPGTGNYDDCCSSTTAFFASHSKYAGRSITCVRGMLPRDGLSRTFFGPW